jgi:hypothetical protein
MNPEQLAAIKARCEAASPGLWQFDDTYRVYNEFGIITMALALDNAVAMADAAFISSAREDVPALLAHAEAETARADAVRRERNQTVASVLGGEVEGRPTGPHNWIQRARALVEKERDAEDRWRPCNIERLEDGIPIFAGLWVSDSPTGPRQWVTFMAACSDEDDEDDRLYDPQTGDYLGLSWSDIEAWYPARIPDPPEGLI